MGFFSATFGGTMTGRGSESLAEALYASPNGFTPDRPGSLEHDRSIPVVQDVRRFSPPEAEALVVESQQLKMQAEATKKAYKALIEAEKADLVAHEAHYGYREQVASTNLGVKKAHGKYATHLEELRPEFAEIGRAHFAASQEADIKVLSAKAHVDALVRGHGMLIRQRGGGLLR